MRTKIILGLLGLMYLLATFRYFPGRLGESLLATLVHLLQSLPLLAALTYLVVLVVRKVAGQGPPWLAIVRIFLLIGLGYEFLFALHHYYNVAV
ncbi:inner-membrane translocator [Desulfurivibrio sp. C05AmB]|jgi:hypothetical protein|uniref:inner-membrane translocator n=1 Tax=Desulfurivibrio sp. C05AmB TaxID=3374371 RepID=UPI00376EBAE1